MMDKTKAQKLKEITDWMIAVEERAEKAEEKFLNECIVRLDKEHTEILETEWGDFKEIWEPLVSKLIYKIKVIEYLKQLQLVVEEATDSAVDNPYQLQIEGEIIEANLVDAILRKSNRENTKILETEWAEYKDIWEKMIKEGHTAKYALNFLKSFA